MPIYKWTTTHPPNLLLLLLIKKPPVRDRPIRTSRVAADGCAREYVRVGQSAYMLLLMGVPLMLALL